MTQSPFSALPDEAPTLFDAFAPLPEPTRAAPLAAASAPAPEPEPEPVAETPHPVAAPRGGMEPTPEQAAIVDAFGTGDNITVVACAGTGKTTVMRLVAGSRPRDRGLYLAFNRSVADEARANFPRNTDAKTAHSLAYGWAADRWGRDLQARLRGVRVPVAEVARILGCRDPLRINDALVLSPTQLARIAMDTVTRWCYSADLEPNARHVPTIKKVDTHNDRLTLAQVVVPLAKKAWRDLDYAKGRLRYQHDHYLKAFALTNPRLDYDFVLLDEAQDANPILVGLLSGQDAQLVAVGDPCQAIYAWRGATDALEAFDPVHRLALTMTWRFGQPVADEANLWLDVLDAENRVQCARPDMDTRLGPLGASADAVLCRGNAAAVEEVLTCHRAGRRVAIVGGGTDIVSFAQAARELMDRGRTNHHDLFPFVSWAEVQDYTRDAHDGQELATWVRLVEEYQPEGVISAISSCVNYGLSGAGAAEAEHGADVVVSTAHKAKGREWDRVRISEDFEASAPGDGKQVQDTEAMLAYVAVTRARHVLDTGGLDWVRRLDENGFLTGGGGMDADGSYAARGVHLRG